MFKHSYSAFFVLVSAALILGFVSMEIATTGVVIHEGQLSGRVTEDFSGASSALGAGTPGSNLLFMLVGIVVGAVIVSTAIFIYHYEKRRMY